MTNVNYQPLDIVIVEDDLDALKGIVEERVRAIRLGWTPSHDNHYSTQNVIRLALSRVKELGTNSLSAETELQLLEEAGGLLIAALARHLREFPDLLEKIKTER